MVRRRWFSVLVLAVAVASAGSSVRAATGGDKISVQLAPWAVHIHDAFGPQEGYDCSGSIIDASHVLTAAHCMFNLSGVFTSASRLTVVAGVSNFRQPRATDARQERAVRSIRVYPGYFSRDPPRWSDVVHDLAVLELDHPLDLSGPTARAVTLASPGDPPSAGSRVAFAGFGRTNPRGGDGPLVRIRGRLLPRDECTTVDGIVCASYVGGQDCLGDSGAGLVTTEGEPRLVGVLSTAAANQTCHEQAQYAGVQTASARTFIFGHSGAGVPPPPPAERWVPSGWKTHTLGPSHQGVPYLAFALPRSWLSKSPPFVAWSPDTGAQVRVGSARGTWTRARYFAVSLARLRNRYSKLDPTVVMHSRELDLPVGRVLEVVTRVRVPQGTGGRRVPLSVRDYIFLRDGLGVEILCISPIAQDHTNLALFEKLARTIHFE